MSTTKRSREPEAPEPKQSKIGPTHHVIVATHDDDGEHPIYKASLSDIPHDLRLNDYNALLGTVWNDDLETDDGSPWTCDFSDDALRRALEEHWCIVSIVHYKDE